MIMRLDVATQNDFDTIIAFYEECDGAYAENTGWTDFYFFDYAQQHVFEYKN